MNFEREDCTRCAGTGNHSYCQRYGTMCFKCQGKGQTLTKRGKAANQWMREQRQINAGDVTVGMGIVIDRTRIIVRKIEVGEKMIWITGKNRSNGLMPNSIVLRQLGTTEHAEMLASAIEYQNTLTKAGKPRKRRAAK